jgi:DUF4097 and DUF4098 domain-containing protein YvlB
MIRLSILALCLVPAAASAFKPDDRAKDVPALLGHCDSDSASTLEAPVRGAVKLRLRAASANIDVVQGPAQKVSVRLKGAAAGQVRLQVAGDNRVEAVLDPRAEHCGHICITVPAYSDVDVSTRSGDVTVSGVGGEARLRTAGGNVHVAGARSLDTRSVVGDVIVEDVSGEVRIQTVSGDARVKPKPGTPPRVSFTSASGDLRLDGTCGPGCRVEARTLSGDVALALTPASSFALHYLSDSGELADDFGLGYRGRASRDVNVRARAGDGAGVIEALTMSGDLSVSRAR